jgi:hypothetical protein
MGYGRVLIDSDCITYTGGEYVDFDPEKMPYRYWLDAEESAPLDSREALRDALIAHGWEQVNTDGVCLKKSVHFCDTGTRLDGIAEVRLLQWHGIIALPRLPGERVLFRLRDVSVCRDLSRIKIQQDINILHVPEKPGVVPNTWYLLKP